MLRIQKALNATNAQFCVITVSATWKSKISEINFGILFKIHHTYSWMFSMKLVFHWRHDKQNWILTFLCVVLFQHLFTAILYFTAVSQEHTERGKKKERRRRSKFRLTLQLSEEDQTLIAVVSLSPPLSVDADRPLSKAHRLEGVFARLDHRWSIPVTSVSSDQSPSPSHPTSALMMDSYKHEDTGEQHACVYTWNSRTHFPTHMRSV